MKYFLILLLLGLCRCSPNEDSTIITGDLWFTDDILRWGNCYNLADSSLERVRNIMDTVNYETADSSLRAFIDMHHKLKNEGLLYKPFIDLESGVKLYMDSADYEWIKPYRRLDLIRENKKVVITAKTKSLGKWSYDLRYCTELIELKLVEGQTFPQSSIWKISDYE